jgi:hypothetical protein
VAATPVHPGDRVALLAVPVSAGQRRDRAGVIEKGVAVGQVGTEVELIRDVRLAVSLRVDVDGVADVVAELVEVGAAGGTLERDVVGDEGDGVRPVGADERVDVRAVGDRVVGNLGRLAMR